MKTPLLLLGVAVGLALMLVVSGSGVRTNQVAAANAVASSASPDPDAAVGELVLARCGGCHGIDTLSQHRQDAAGWTQTIAAMQKLGVQVSPDEQVELVNYLAKHFAP